ncbi:MAG TPA: hypothetical protein VGM69_25960 [Chloroflexota bacterium]
MVEQVPVTIIAPVRPEALQPLRELLETMGPDPSGNDVVPFGRFGGVHFARFVVLEPTVDLKGRPIPPSLLFLSDVDGPAEAFLGELVVVAGPGIDRLYAHCGGYPAEGDRTRETRLAYLRAHRVEASAAYVNTHGRTVEQIRQEARLREAIEEFVDRSRPAWSGVPATAVRSAIQDFVASQEALRWARQPPDGDGLSRRLGQAGALAAGALPILLVAPAALVALPSLVVLLRLHELTDPVKRLRPSDRRVQELGALEDHVVHNQFSAVGFVKPSPFRRLVALGVLWLVNFGARHLFGRADLAGVKTIHFARWVFVDEGRRLFFASNYDGSLESYMDDFIDKVAWGLNAVFSNGVDYPRTNWLVLDGAKDEEAFKSFIRTHQIPTQVWYAAYDQLTALNIENNARIREGLSGSLGADEVEAWLRRL